MALPALVVLYALLSFASAASVSTPLPPSQDSFYTAPEGFEASSPGAVLRVRVAPGNLTTLFTNVSQAYHILYRKTDSN